MGSHDWESAGLYDPDDPSAPERRQLLEYLVDRGATVDQMVEAHRRGNLPAVAGDLVRGAPSGALSVKQMAVHAGISVSQLQRLFLATGLPVTSDTMLPEGLGENVIAAFNDGVAVLGEEGILAFTRVLGAAATTIAEAAVALFYAELGPGAEREGADELARAEASEAAMLAFVQVPDVLSAILVTQFDRVSQRVALSRGWSSSRGAQDAATQEPSEVVGFGFVDLVGSTRWADGLSLRDHSLALSRFESMAWSKAVVAGGRVVKMIGDEAFFAADSADAACSIATEICLSAEEDPVLPRARGAVGYGRVVPREGDYFGPGVNLVSRLTKVALPGAVVATAEAAASLPRERWDLAELERQAVRGLTEAVQVFVVSERVASNRD